MDNMAFEAWLAMILSLTVEQRQRVFMALALAEADDSPQEAAAVERPPVVVLARGIRTRAARRGKGAAARAGSRPGGGEQPGRSQGMSTLCQPGPRALGPRERFAPLSLWRLPADLQRTDRDGDGEFA